jgi:hypothetical protein
MGLGRTRVGVRLAAGVGVVGLWLAPLGDGDGVGAATEAGIGRTRR